MKWKTYFKYALIILLPVGFLLNYISSLNREMTQQVYSNFFYKGIYKSISSIIGYIPVSVAEILLILVVLVFAYHIVKTSVKFVKSKSLRISIVKTAFIDIFALAGVTYFAFVIMWGMNYNRPPISELFELEIIPASIEELTQLSSSLIDEMNELRNLVQEDESGVMYPKNGYKGAIERAVYGFEAAEKVYPQMGTMYGKPKPILLSKWMSHTGIWGIYAPFTFEANINTNIPAPLLTATISHEMAHGLGFAREEEANYIAYLTSKMHPDIDFNYSGMLFAFIHSMNELYLYDSDTYNTLILKLNDGVIRDMQAIRSFNQSYDGNVKQAFSDSNDMYLKANRQKEGERSYRRVVDLLIAEYRKQSTDR